MLCNKTVYTHTPTDQIITIYIYICIYIYMCVCVCVCVITSEYVAKCSVDVALGGVKAACPEVLG